MISFWPWRRFNVQDNGLWKGMTEIHCHLLPGVDDGAETREDALRILRFMEKEVKVGRVCITPHTMMDFNSSPGERLKEKFREFMAGYDGNMELYIASEYMIDGFFPDRLAEGLLLLGEWNQKKMVLVEMPMMMIPLNLNLMLDNIFEAGYTPVIAHPERYYCIKEKTFYYLHERGCLMQLNIPSLRGYYGKNVEKTAFRLLAKGLYDFAGFDIHRYEGYAGVIRQLHLSRGDLDRLCLLLDNNKEIHFDSQRY